MTAPIMKAWLNQIESLQYIVAEMNTVSVDNLVAIELAAQEVKDNLERIFECGITNKSKVIQNKKD